MKIYLAGGVTGNLISFWKKAMELYLAGTYSRPFVFEKAMELYLAGIQGKAKDFVINDNKPYILESFFYIRDQHKWLMELRPAFKNFLLDSGAFTYLNGASGNVDWNKYLREYADFINRHQVDLFIELDIDPIVGLKKVDEMRSELESMTGKKAIPVWHKSRGLAYWEKITQEYDYVAIGGIVTKEIKRKEYPAFTKLLAIAKRNDCKVHGLGFTNLEGIKKYPFHSVDSTAWLYGNRGGYIYQFTGDSIKQIKLENKRLKGREAAVHNFHQWCKFAHYAENNL